MITMYTKDSCAKCISSKMTLKMKNIEYNEVEITENHEEFLERYQADTFPVIVLDNGEYWFGFNPKKLSELSE
ncbi:glutaredoxin family protein [Aerococcaceae bacterium zg-B36]|uniref:glutaredoxin family protein n=1 Tax=Aerococcaceae bacterium zg-252 TaxID=2796928 RepID=UPI001BD851AA|nr:glutaredoxin family protein [Aerococcaceae bacterium zg-B36]